MRLVRIALWLRKSLGSTGERLESQVRLIHSATLLLLLLVHAAWLLIARVIGRGLWLIVWEKCRVGPVAWCRV